MQGRGTTHRSNRLLRATAWLQHPPRPAIRQEAGRSSQAIHPFRETSICGNACCSFACAVLTPCYCSPCFRQWAGDANSTQRFTCHHGDNQGFRHHPKQSAPPVHDTATKDTYMPECLSATSSSSARAAFPCNQCSMSPG